MNFVDIHMHALYGSDDGAKSAIDMQNMIDDAYRDGARYICLTPHFHPGCYGENRERSDMAFLELSKYVESKYSDLHIAIGNELYYVQGGEYWLQEGSCRTLNGTNYVLVDFPLDVRKKTILNATNRLLSLGYRPILAHVERYRNIFFDTSFVVACKQSGALIQIDSMSIFGDFGFMAKRLAHALLSKKLVDFVSSDAHDVKKRPPKIRSAYENIVGKYGLAYANKICYENAKNMFFR